MITSLILMTFVFDSAMHCNEKLDTSHYEELKG